MNKAEVEWGAEPHPDEVVFENIPPESIPSSVTGLSPGLIPRSLDELEVLAAEMAHRNAWGRDPEVERELDALLATIEYARGGEDPDALVRALPVSRSEGQRATLYLFWPTESN